MLRVPLSASSLALSLALLVAGPFGALSWTVVWMSLAVGVAFGLVALGFPAGRSWCVALAANSSSRRRNSAPLNTPLARAISLVASVLLATLAFRVAYNNQPNGLVMAALGFSVYWLFAWGAFSMSLGKVGEFLRHFLGSSMVIAGIAAVPAFRDGHNLSTSTVVFVTFVILDAEDMLRKQRKARRLEQT